MSVKSALKITFHLICGTENAFLTVENKHKGKNLRYRVKIWISVVRRENIGFRCQHPSFKSPLGDFEQVVISQLGLSYTVVVRINGTRTISLCIVLNFSQAGKKKLLAVRVILGGPRKSVLQRLRLYF